jgi:hypothetical protein
MYTSSLPAVMNLKSTPSESSVAATQAAVGLDNSRHLGHLIARIAIADGVYRALFLLWMKHLCCLVAQHLLVLACSKPWLA